MDSVVITGAAGPVAATIVERLAAHLPETRITVLAPRPIPELEHVDGSPVSVEVLDLAGADVGERFTAVGAEAVVHLGGPVDGLDPFKLAPGRAAVEARAVLDAARVARVAQVAVVSSTLVLGALPANPVPMTEDAVVHPEAQFRPAVELAEIEREVAEHRNTCSECATTTLRTAPVVAEGVPGWLASEIHRSLAYPTEGHDPELQYVHADDLADAIRTMLAVPIEGVVHVAPDGWLTGAERRALETRPRLRVPDPVARSAAAVLGAVRGTSGPEGVRPYVTFPWVVANDRLREAGWEPKHTNDEAYVAAFRAAPWSMVSSSRRQELALGGAAAVVLGVGAAVIGLTARRRQR
jgi:nucleoside-diphosphate-sugar epimerase